MEKSKSKKTSFSPVPTFLGGNQNPNPISSSNSTKKSMQIRPPSIPSFPPSRSTLRAQSPHSAAKRQLSNTFMQSLAKPPESRTADDISILMHFVGNIKAFKELESPQKCKEICQVMTSMRLSYGEVLFKQGDDANCMFIILKGTVAVRIKIKEMVSHDNLAISSSFSLISSPSSPSSPTLLTSSSSDTSSSDCHSFPRTVLPTKINDARNDSVGTLTVVSLGAGEKVGHLALVKDVPRSATIIAEEECEFLVINRDDFQRILKIHLKNEIEINNTFLWKFSLFQGMPPFSMGRLAEIALTYSFHEGECIFDVNDDTDGLYLIRKGEVQVSKLVSFAVKTNKGGKKQIKKLLKIGTLGPDELFGEIAIYHNSKRVLKAVAKSNVVCLFLNKYDFQARASLQILHSLVSNVEAKYPSDEMLEDQYYDSQENKKWEKYKSKLCQDVMKDKEHRRISAEGCSLRNNKKIPGKKEWR